MTAPNAELAYRVLDHIDAHPEQWDQGVYIGKVECGTVACFAGWTVLLSGLEPGWHRDSSRESGYRETTNRTSTGESVSEAAEGLLRASRYIDEGSDYERDLFEQFNTREDLDRLVAEIFGPRPAVTR
jgi:hypothetical protein